MSTFCGQIDEIPFISVDRFDGENLKSELFFLSHCHTDHMKGLYATFSGPLYLSAASAIFIKKQYPGIKSLHVMETECPYEIEYEVNKTTYSIVVTALPARHCPGSVMFLFQTTDLNILYTGDFRITNPDLSKNFSSLERNSIDVVYLDSTFLSKDFKEFPSQIDSINRVLQLISEWLNIHPKNKIIIELPARYGSEYLLTEIERKLHEKVYVNNEQWEKYAYFPDMDNCICNDENKCRIRITGGYCRYNELHERTIRVSAAIWKNWKKGNDFVERVHENFYKVAFSYHSSLLEIKEFLDFVKPKKVKLNVIPSNIKERMKMYETLEEIYPGMNESNEIEKKEINFTNIFVNSNSHGECSENDKFSVKKRERLPKRIKFV